MESLTLLGLNKRQQALRKNLFLLVSAVGMSLCATPYTWADDVSSTQLRPPIVQGESLPDKPFSIAALKQLVGHNDKSKPYDQAKKIQAQPRSIGGSPISRVEKSYDKSTASTTTAEDFISISKPPLKALVSIDANLNPYGLESEYSQEIGLRSALRAAIEGNLDVLRSVTDVQAQKWRLLNSYTGYLPSISLGFNEVGLNSITAIPIKALARTNTGSIVSAGAFGTATGGALGGTNISTTAETVETIIQSPLTVLNSGFTWKPFQGGKLIGTALAQKHRLQAYRAQLVGSVSDTLLSCAKDYYTLVLNDALLQIRTSAVASSEEQLRQNGSLESAGLATNLELLQAKNQLSKDRQELINQQRERRTASVELAHLLNANLGQDLIPAEHTLKKVRLISPDLRIADLLAKAIDNRPELKQYEELRQAAKKDILIASSQALPTVSLGGNIIGIASNIGRMEPTLLINMGVTWKFDGLGTKALTELQTSRWTARRALIDANQKFSDVMQEVRNSYNQSFTAESAILESSNAVASGLEELRLARLRLDAGLGTNLEVLNAQRDLTEARIDKARAIVDFNTAQVQLVHDIGLVSVDNLTSGKLITSSSTR